MEAFGHSGSTFSMTNRGLEETKHWKHTVDKTLYCRDSTVASTMASSLGYCFGTVPVSTIEKM